MFKKIQNYLLINNPLLWNLKIVPLLTVLIGFQFLFFFIGFINGAIDFSETERNYNYDYDEVILFFSVLVSIIILILWIVFYFKNNAYKSYYPIKKYSLFKEWGIILFVSFLLCSPTFIYFFGKDMRVKSYYSENEAKKRCDILNKGSLFIGNNFQQPKYVDKIVNDSMTSVPLDYVLFNNKKYSLNSIFNKEIEGFSFTYQNQDSLTKRKVESWLQNNQKDSVRLVLSNYLKLAQEHHLKSNIDAEKWLSIVYNYPNFESPKIVAEIEKEYYSDYQYPYNRDTKTVVAVVENQKFDSINQFLVKVGKETFVHNKTYVPAKSLNYNYQKIAEAYTNPTVKLEQLLATLYVALGLSLLLFSFRTSSGRNWLIALVSMGVINIIIGIFSVIFSSKYTYLISILVLTILLFVFFIIVLKRKTSKGISGIILNGLVWLTPTFIPIVYYLILEFAKAISGYNEYDYYNNNLISIDSAFPKIAFMKDYEISIPYLNVIFIILMMAFYSVKIKKWKGIAEN